MFADESDPSELPTEQLEHQIATLAAQIYAATCRMLCLLAEFDRRECHLRLGFHSATAWLSWTCGLTQRAAREHVRVARELARLPAIRESFGRGELSYSKVRALTRVAEPETEAELLELAHNATAAQLERSVRAFRSAIAVAEDGPPPDLYFAWAWEDDGTLSVRGRLSADEGALLIEAIHHGHAVVRGRGPVALYEGDGPPPPPQRHTDALAAACEASLASTGAASGGDRYQVVVHVDGQTGRAELDEGSALGPDAARRLLCDAAVVAVASDEGGEPLSVGRRSRTVPVAIRRALRARDRGCRFPGCSHERFVDAHHITHWADGGATSADNLVTLCRRHHRLIHEGGFGVARRADGELEFRRPGGSALGARPPRTSAPDGTTPAIAPRARKPPLLASGDALDLDLTVDCMVQRYERAMRERAAVGPP